MTGIAIGGLDFPKIGLGDTEVVKVSLGDVLVWPASPLYPQIARLEFIGSTTGIGNADLPMPAGVQDGDLVIYSVWKVADTPPSSGVTGGYPLIMESPTTNPSAKYNQGYFCVGVKSPAMANPIPHDYAQYQNDKICLVYRAYDSNNNVIPISNFDYKKWTSQNTTGNPTLTSCLLNTSDYSGVDSLFVTNWGCFQTISDAQAIFTGATPSRSLVTNNGASRLKILENPTLDITMTTDMAQIGASNYIGSLSLIVLPDGTIDLGTETLTATAPPSSGYCSGTVSFGYTGVTTLFANASGGPTTTTSPASNWNQIGSGTPYGKSYFSYRYLAKTLTGTGASSFLVNEIALAESGVSGENRRMLGTDGVAEAEVTCNFGAGTADVSIEVRIWADATSSEPLSIGVYNFNLSNS